MSTGRFAAFECSFPDDASQALHSRFAAFAVFAAFALFRPRIDPPGGRTGRYASTQYAVRRARARDTRLFDASDWRARERVQMTCYRDGSRGAQSRTPAKRKGFWSERFLHHHVVEAT